jgi:porin
MILFGRLRLKSILLLASVYLASPTVAEEAAPPESLRDRAQLFGDWYGARTALAQRGIIVDLQATQFYQGVVRGSGGTNDWQYGAKADLFTTVLGERLGLWKGLIINMHLEGRVGDDVNGLSGLSPTNSPMLMPSSEDEVALTQFMAIQMLRPDFGIAGGKFSAYDFTDMAFHTGRGIDGFMNISLVLPLGLGRNLRPSGYEPSGSNHAETRRISFLFAFSMS